jgi:hypothetical protein
LFVLEYEASPDEPKTTYVERVRLPGNKVGGWNEFFKSRPDILQKYSQIALVDNDLECNSADINLAFRMGREYGLWLWQPALTWDSYFSYAIFLRNPLFKLRYVNFIEMMCPFFSSEHLKHCLGLFDLGYETGIDRLWCRMRDGAEHKYAVLDAVEVKHTEPVGAVAYLQGFVGETANYQSVIDRMEQRFGVYFRGPVAYAGILINRTIVKGRLAMAVFSLLIALGIRKTKIPRFFVKSVSDHIRHNLTRPTAINNINPRNF